MSPSGPLEELNYDSPSLKSSSFLTSDLGNVNPDSSGAQMFPVCCPVSKKTTQNKLRGGTGYRGWLVGVFSIV